MPQAAVSLFLEVGVTAQTAPNIPHGGGAVLADSDMLLTEMGSAVSSGLEQGKVTCCAEIWIERPGGGAVEVAAFVAPGEEASPAGPAGRGGDKRILESHASGGETVKMRSLDHGMARAAEGVIALIVCEQKENVGLARGCHRNEQAQEKEG